MNRFEEFVAKGMCLALTIIVLVAALWLVGGTIVVIVAAIHG